MNECLDRGKRKELDVVDLMGDPPRRWRLWWVGIRRYPKYDTFVISSVCLLKYHELVVEDYTC